MTNLCELANLLGVSTDYLLGRTDIKLDINALNEPLSSDFTKADILRMLEQSSPEDCAYIMRTIRLLYYYRATNGDQNIDV